MTEIPTIITNRIKFLVTAFVLVASGSIILGVLSYRGFKKEFRNDVENYLNAISNLKVAEIVQWRKERIGDGSAFLTNQVFSDLVSRFIASPSDHEVSDMLGEWLKKIRSAYAYEHVLLINARGQKLLSDPLDTIPVPVHLINDINAVSKIQKVTFLDFHRYEPGGPVRLGILIPVLDQDNSDRFIANMVFVINPEVYLYPLINNWPTASRTAETLLLRREGDSVLFLNELRFLKNTALNLRVSIHNTSLPAVSAALGNKGIFTGIDYRGVPVISSLNAIPGSPWFMVTRMDIKEVFAPLRARWWTVVLVEALLILSFAYFIYTLWRQQKIRYFHEKYELEKDKAKTIEALAESERKFRETIKYLDEGYYSVTTEGILLDHNHAFNRILGFDVSRDMRGSRLPDFWKNPDERKAYLQELMTNGSILNYVINAKRLDGEKIVVLANAHLVKNEIIESWRIEGTFTDFTQLKQAEEAIQILNKELEQRVSMRTSQLESANKELEAFSYSVSHDLRAPLRAVDGFSKFVLEDYAEKLDSEGKRMLGLIRSNTQKMDQLITDLLNLSRVSRRDLQYSEINMAQMALSMFNESAPCALKDNIDLKIGKLPEAFADPVFIKQVWINLLSNAIKFTSKKKKPKIRISGKTESPDVIYSIKDNGAGFNQQYANKLFGVFQRLHKSDDFEGTGVGLAIIQRIIHRHGGKVWAEGSEGKGATFYFSLPGKK